MIVRLCVVRHGNLLLKKTCEAAGRRPRIPGWWRALKNPNSVLIRPARITSHFNPPHLYSVRRAKDHRTAEMLVVAQPLRRKEDVRAWRDTVYFCHVGPA